MVRMRAAIMAALVLLAAMQVGCADARIRKVRRFNDAIDRGDLATARGMMRQGEGGSRVWYESPAGEGMPWTLGEGAYSEWDKHFKSKKTVLGDYQRDGDCVWCVVSETNDYYLLTERPWSRVYMMWGFDLDGKIDSLLVAEVGEPTSRSREFREWARANDPAELDDLVPNGRLDVTGDRAVRMRALLNRWRGAVGLDPIP